MLTRAVIVRLIAYSVVLLWMSVELFWSIAWAAPAFTLTTIVASIFVYAITLALHEWVHGAGMRIFGARPRYGVMVVRRMLPVAYATAPGHRFTLSQMVIIGLAPLLTLSAASLAVAVLVPSLGYYAWVVFASNFSGAVGDLWMVWVLMRFRRFQDVCVIDEKFGLSVESTDPRAALVADTLDLSGWRLTRLAASSFVVLTSFAWLGLPIAGWLAPADPTHLLVGPEWFPLIEWTPSYIGFEPRNLLIASVLLALPTLLLPRPGRRSAADGPKPGPDAPGVPALI
jgi:hypothetical protein